MQNTLKISLSAFVLIWTCLLAQGQTTCLSNSPDTDGDGVCNILDQCPNIDDSLIGSPCDDGKSCTTNDLWVSSCDCEGTPLADSDNDGVCDAEDQFSNFDDDMDVDGDGIPYRLDNCVDVNQNGICDDVDTAPFTQKLKVFFSLKRGFYNNAVEVTLVANRPNTTIRYSLGNNPSCPTVNVGTVYSGPIRINNSDIQTLKVIGSNGVDATKVYTHSYLFNGRNLPTVVFSCSPYPVAPGKSENPISFEFIVPSDHPLKSIQEYAGTAPSRGGVQSGTSDKVYFRSAYGAGTLKEDLFSDHYYGEKPVARFDQLFLRGDHSYGTRLNQLIAHDALRATGQLSPAGRHVEFYEDGSLEDVRHLQERPEGGFMEAWTGNDKPNYDAYSGDQHADLDRRILAGDWTETKRLMNTESFGNFLLNQWIGNCWDFWSNRNYRTAGPTNLDSADFDGLRWHYFNWDWDLAFPASPTSWRHSAFASPEGILRDVRQKVEFQLEFSDIIHCSMYEDGALTGSEYVDRVRYRHAELQEFVTRNPRLNVGYTNSDVNAIISYLPRRVDWLKDQLRSNDYYSVLNAVEFSLDGGTVSAGEQLVLSNPNTSGTIYYTLDGSDVRSEAGVLNPNAIRYTGPITLTAGVSDVFARVHNPVASSMVDRWSATCGPTAFYVDQAYSNVIINEIHYSPLATISGVDTVGGNNYEFIELKNTGSTAIDLKGSSFTKGIELTIESSLIIEPGGFAVFAENAAVFEATYGYAPDGQYEGKLSNDGEKVNFKDPLGYFIDTVRYSHKDPWDEAAFSTGYSLELLHSSLDSGDPLNWFRSDNVGGTPRAENSRTCAQAGAGIVINEINYNSSDQRDGGDWVELHNPTARDIDLSGWTLYDSGSGFVLPQNTTLAAGAYVVLVAKEADFRAAFPAINSSKIIAELGFGLSGSGERISLFDANKCLADYVIYNDKSPWPEAPDGDGPSLSLLEPSMDNSLPQSWESSMVMNASFTNGSPSVSNVCVPGQSCDDGDACTSNDTFDADCNCVGTLQTTDSDGDGVCDVADICPGFDDNLIGTPCDDGNECSVGETFDTDCGCSGGVVSDVDSDGLCDVLDTCDDRLVGTSCEDGDPCTIGETYDNDCNCSGGVAFDTDNDGVCNTEDLCEGLDDALIGQVCDDGNPMTEFDMYTADACGCVGIITSDEVCARIEASSDDAEESSSTGSVSISSTDIEMISISSSVDNIVGLRFNNLNIPQGATITDATIQFTADESRTTPMTVTIVGEANDNPSTFTTTRYSVTTRPTTTASVEWSAGAWPSTRAAGPDQRTVDLSPIIQEIVNRPNFVSGNSMVLLIKSGTGLRTAESFNGSPTEAAQLCVSYNTGVCQVGYPCDDLDATTENDVLQEDCGCAGTLIDPDNDSDGVVASLDCDDNDANLTVVGASCDDSNATTENDVVLADCTCAGTLIDPDNDGDGVVESLDCDDNDANLTVVGASCDDGDTTTENDVVLADCTCAGTPIFNTPLNITGINYNPLVNAPLVDDDFEFLMVTNFGADSISVAGDSIKGISFVFPQGEEIAAGETVLLVKDLDAYPDLGLRRILWDGSKLSNGGEQLVFKKEDNSVINDLTYDDVAPWPTTPDGGGFYLKLISDELDNTVAENWVAIELPSPLAPDACAASGGDADGDGFCADIDCDDTNPSISQAGDACDDGDATTENDVVQTDCGCAGTPINTSALNITGINYNPLVDSTLVDDDFEFLMVTNFGADSISVAGDSIKGISFVFPQGEGIAAGETVMLVKDLTVYPDLGLRRILWDGSKLSNGGEQLVFKKEDNSVINDLTYDDASPWPTSPDGDGYYLKLISSELDNTIAANWEAILLPAPVVNVDPCAALGGDADGDGVCAANDCDDTNAAISQAGDACDDGDASTENDVIQTDCSCAGTPIQTGGCQAAYSVNGFTLSVQNLDAPITAVKVLDAAYNELFVCNDFTVSCGNPEVITLPAIGSYFIQIQTFEDWSTPVCNIFEGFEVTGVNPCATLGGDSDNDGICDDNDPCDNNLAGTSCDDFDATTENDVYDNNCNCAGTPIAQPDCPVLGANFGDACDDLDASTENDVVQTDCSCAGTPIQTGGCQATYSVSGFTLSVQNLDAPITAVKVLDGAFNELFVCNDFTVSCGNPEVITLPAIGSYFIQIQTFEDWSTPVCNIFEGFEVSGVDPCAALGGDSDNDGICDDNDPCDNNLAGTSCDDLDATTENDVYDNNCNCAGTPIAQPDCPTIGANFGDACDDLNATTFNDAVQPDCSCAGTTPPAGVDLELSASSAQSTVAIYTANAVTVTLTNTGGQAATGIEVFVPKPEDVVYTGGNEYTASQGALDIFGSTPGVWSVGTLAAGESATIVVNYFSLSATGYAQYGEVLGLNEQDVDSNPGNGSGLGSNEDDEFYLDLSTNQVLGLNIDFYPNPVPAGEQIVLKYMSSGEVITPLLVSDLNGRVIFRTKVEFAEGFNEVPVSIGDLPSGVYIISLSDTGLQPTRLIVR